MLIRKETPLDRRQQLAEQGAEWTEQVRQSLRRSSILEEVEILLKENVPHSEIKHENQNHIGHFFSQERATQREKLH